MNLVKERLSWHEQFEKGEVPNWPKYVEYKQNRLSEEWRDSRASEKFYEYVVWLEEQLDDLDLDPCKNCIL